MNFRPIDEKDLCVLIDVRAATRENPFSREALHAIGVTEASVGEMLRTSHRGWLCEDAERIVGFAIGDGKTGELWVIAILPEYEGRGIGFGLLGLVESWMGSLGWKTIWLWTSTDRSRRAFAFYTKRGWMVSREEGGRLYMTKDLHGV